MSVAQARQTYADRVKAPQIPLRSNIFNPHIVLPQDKHGQIVNLLEPLTQTYIQYHPQKTMPRVVREVYIPEEYKQEEEEWLKQQVKVVSVVQQEKEMNQEAYEFENRIKLLLEQFNSEKRDAFETANMLTVEIMKYKADKLAKLEKNRQIVAKRVAYKKQSDTQRIDEENKKNKVEIKRLFRSIKEVVQHILAGGGEQKYKRFAQDNEVKEHITLEFVKDKQKGAEEVKAATEIMQLVRLFLSKKTDEMEVFKQLYGEDFLTDPSILKDLSESKDSASVASDKLSKIHDDLKTSEEDIKLNPFYDLNQLKLKWGVSTETEVKDNIRRILTRNVLQDGERQKVKQEIEEEEIKARLIKTDARFARMFREQEKKKSEKAAAEREEISRKEELRKAKYEAQQKKREEQELKQSKFAAEIKKKRMASKQPKNPKREAENRIKKEFFETAQTTSLVYGDVFQRTKNFGDLFKQKTQEFYNSNAIGSQNNNFTSTSTFDQQIPVAVGL